jgi:hypothetical protein
MWPIFAVSSPGLTLSRPKILTRASVVVKRYARRRRAGGAKGQENQALEANADNLSEFGEA